MFEKFNPHSVKTAELELTSPCLFTILDDAEPWKGLEQSLQVLSQPTNQFSWLIFVKTNSELDLAKLENMFTQAPEQLEIGILQEAESAFELPEIYAAAYAYLDLNLYAQMPLAFEQAAAMNLPIICHAQTTLGLLPPQACLFHNDTQSIEFEKLAAIKAQISIRGSWMQRLAETGKSISHLNQQLKWLTGHADKINLTSICFWGRSGSVLLSSLLDSHPETVMIGTGDFAAISVFEQIWTYLKQFQFNNLASLLDEFCSSRRKENLPANKHDFSLFSESQPEFEAAFKFYFHFVLQSLVDAFGLDFLKEKTRKACFIACHYAHYLAKGLDITGRHLIVFQVHWPEDLPQFTALLSDFPDFKPLGMIRTPIRGYYSMLAHILQQNQDKNWQWEDLVLTGRYLHTLRHILMGWQLAETLINKSFYTISLENLHQEPQKVMKALANHLRINWHQSLLASSIDGKPLRMASGVHGEINASKAVFDPERVNYSYWKQELSDVDKFVLEGVLCDVMERYFDTSISNFHKTLSLVFVFLPMRLEKKAFQKALSQRSEEQIKLVLLNYAERCYYILLFICGYRFNVSPPQYRKKTEHLLGIQKTV